METIRMSGLLPSFAIDEAGKSDVWRNDITFDKGENTLIAAASGSGKSSLLAYIVGERKDFSGNIFFDDRNTAHLSESEWCDVRQRHIACIFQGLRLFPSLTVWENLTVKNRLTRYKSDAELERLLEQTGIADKRETRAAKLSFGQQQRVAIIRALCQPFDFLLADEPFSHLDDENIVAVSNIITDELQARGAGMALCSLGAPYQFVYQKVLNI